MAEDEFKLTGDEATARWRQVRGLFYVELSAAIAVLLASWLLWHRTPAQLGRIGLGLSLVNLAALIWKHNLLAFSYYRSSDSGGTEVTFVGKPPPVPRKLAIPVLIAAGGLLVLAGTSTGLGYRLASAFDVVKALDEARQSTEGIIGIPLAIIIILIMIGAGLMLVGEAVAMAGRGVYFLIKFAVRRFRPDPEEGTGAGNLLEGVATLVFSCFFLTIPGYIIYYVIRFHDTVFDESSAPFRTIWGWFN